MSQIEQYPEFDSGGTDMREFLARQKTDCIIAGPADYDIRIDRLNRLEQLLRENKVAICQALSDDFGHRSIEQSMLTEIAAPIASIKHARDQLHQWMKPKKRKLPLLLTLLGAKATVNYQPLGTVGVIVPWNFPIYLTMGPLVGILAAGNRAMVKPSEFTPRVSALLAVLFPRYFDEMEIAVFTGGADISAAFSELPFDHLFFTGSGSIARHVMAAAAKNLVPVTLELGGKSPVIISRDANLEKAAVRIMDFKMSNAGQACIAPDYLLVPEEKLDQLVAILQATVARLFPSLLNNPDYTSIVNESHFNRLQSYIDDAMQTGITIIELNPAEEDFNGQPHYKMAPRLFINPGENNLIMQNEIFGPLLPIKTYKQVDEAVAYINQHDKPLALYYFGEPNSAEMQQVLTRTVSGGVSINDVAANAACESLPFGGVGPSGMGAYHGYDGYMTFSHARAVYKQSKINLADVFGVRAPYGKKFKAATDNMMK